MQDKGSCACPALVLHAGRAEKWQLRMVQPALSPSKHRLFCRSKKPLGNGTQRRTELTPATNLKESPRALVEPSRCKSSRQEWSRKHQEELWQGAVLSAAEDKKQPLGVTLGAHPESLESFLPHRCRARGLPLWSTKSNHPPKWPKGTLARDYALCCRGRQKTCRDAS